MVVVHATGPLTSVMTASFTLHHKTPKEAPESPDLSALRHEHSAKCEAEQNTALSEARQAKHDNVLNPAEAVHYKPRTGRESQTDQHVRRGQDTTAQ